MVYTGWNVYLWLLLLCLSGDGTLASTTDLPLTSHCRCCLQRRPRASPAPTCACTSHRPTASGTGPPATRCSTTSARRRRSGCRWPWSVSGDSDASPSVVPCGGVWCPLSAECGAVCGAVWCPLSAECGAVWCPLSAECGAVCGAVWCPLSAECGAVWWCVVPSLS